MTEVESAIESHPAVAKAAVLGFSHDVKGEAIYTFVTLKPGQVPSDFFKAELIQQVRRLIGPIATPELIQWTDGLQNALSLQDMFKGKALTLTAEKWLKLMKL